jgi:Inheritance of peroxisomes protein 1
MSSPSTPEHPPPSIHTTVRRVQTLPPKLFDPTRTPPQINHGADAIETLFYVTSAKVVAFDAPTSSSRPNSQSGARTTDQSSQLNDDGSLSWISPTERTLAAGTSNWFETSLLFLDDEVTSICTKHIHAYLGRSALTCSPDHPLSINTILLHSCFVEISTLTRIGIGPLKIYRVSNTGVSFLNSGRFLKHILSKSQCWCVDEEATFVLRGRDDSFYRIELPGSTAEEKESVEQFKKTLDQLLRYEKTPCPFRKGYFNIAEQPLTPVRRKSVHRLSPAKKWRLNKIWEPEDAELRAEFEARLRSGRTYSNESGIRPVTPLQGFSSTRESPLRHMAVDVLDRDELGHSKDEVLIEAEAGAVAMPYDEDESNALHGTFERHDSVLVAASDKDQAPSIGSNDHGSNSESQEDSDGRGNESAEEGPPKSEEILIHPLKQHPVPTRLRTLRSATAPPHLTITASPPSNSNSLKVTTDDAETASIASSRDSFYSLEDDAAEPVSQSNGVDLTNEGVAQLHTIFVPSHSRNSSGTSSMVPETPRAIVYPTNSLPFTTIAFDSSSDSEQMPHETGTATPPTTLRLRRPLKSEEIETAMTGSDNITRLPTAIPISIKPIGAELIRTTYTILMSPPSHLISLMLRIAGIIVNRMPSRVSRHIPGSWESSDIDDDEDSSDDVWNEISDHEDDFGYPISNYKVRTEAVSNPPDEAQPSPNPDNWEID